MKGRARKQRFVFKGEVRDDSILIGSHGDATVQIDGVFDLSGIIYCPKYTVTLTIKGEGRISFRGKCNRIIIRKMEGNCVLDLSDVTCKELRCEWIKDQATVISGKTRLISQANLNDKAELHIAERPLITSSAVNGSSRIVRRSVTTNI
jgi:hypothetical protein